MEFSMYSLCIDTSDKSDEEIQNFDATTREIVCVEGKKKDANMYLISSLKILDACFLEVLLSFMSNNSQIIYWSTFRLLFYNAINEKCYVLNSGYICWFLIFDKASLVYIVMCLILNCS